MAYKKPDSIDPWPVFMRRIYNEWDADPGYYAIRLTDVPYAQKLRLAVAWCSYYNLGIAADASEYQGKRFWDYLTKIYPTAKRATERRHFRGRAGMVALEQWRENWPKPEALAEFVCLAEGSAKTYFDIRKRGQQVAQYGDYFFWKWCDLHEVLGFGTVDMRNSEKHSPKLPQQGALLIRDMGEWVEADTDAQVVKEIYARVAARGRKLKVPVRTIEHGLREFSIQEAETVCCVYKQMSSGSYIYGTRTAKAVRRLRAATSDTAAAMADTLLQLSPYSEAELNAALDSLTE